MTLLPLLAGERIGDACGGRLLCRPCRQVQGGSDLVKSSSSQTASILDHFLQRPDLALGSDGAHFNPADPLGQYLVSLDADPRHLGDVGQ
ncbi:hypothetical protein D3C85_1627060 [compost metagenome]